MSRINDVRGVGESRTGKVRRWTLLLGMIALLAGTTGCINPVSPEQMSDWRWKQWNPDYQPKQPTR